MEKVRLEVGDRLKVYIKSIGGDLRLAGRNGTVFEAQAPLRGDLHVDQDGDRVSVSCRSSCLLFMPAGSPVEAEQIGGEARITGLSNDLMIKTVGGDLSLRRVGRSTFELIGGDLHARKVSGDLTIDRVGGDAVVEQVQGNIRLRTVGGDLRLQRVEGIVEASIGGHASVDINISTLRHSLNRILNEVDKDLFQPVSVRHHRRQRGPQVQVCLDTGFHQQRLVRNLDQIR